MMAKSKHSMPPIQDLYQSWFEEYASYVVLHRAIPNIEDGLKPSQRRCLHALKELDDGRYNKLANVVGHTMAYHPHGDCLAGTTPLFCLNGQEITIEAAYQQKVKSLDILTFDEKTGKPIPGTAENFRIGQFTKTIYRIHTNAGYLDVTKNHPWLLKALGYKKAEELKINQVLESTTVSEGQGGRIFLKTPGEGLTPLHRIVGEFHQGNIPIFHHIDENPKNNSPENLLGTTRGEHAEIHKDYHKGLELGRTAMFQENGEIAQANKAKNSLLMSETNKWQGIRKAKQVIELITAQGKEITQETYQDTRKKVYNAPELKTLAENYDVTIEKLIEFDIPYDRTKATGLRKKEVKKQKNPPPFARHSYFEKLIKLLNDILNTNQNLTDKEFEIIRKEKTKNQPPQNRNIGKLKTHFPNGLTEFLTNTDPLNGIRIQKIEVIELETPIPMYDFTVNGTENMYVPLLGYEGKNKPMVVLHNSSLIETFVNIAQKGWLIDTQGNWGNTITGEGNAAQRYIECRLTPFAKEILFAPKITEWIKSYDGRRNEPVHLPSKFPLLLLQGTEGIAVGLACSILPHNFTEITEACIAHLRKEPFVLLPDFPCGGDVDISTYTDGTDKGRIRIRAKIEIRGKNQLAITELPYGVTSTALLENIVSVVQKGKIKVKEVEDLSVETPEVIVTLAPGSDPEKSREALFAFTKCEVSKTANTAVIKDGKPWFCSTSELLIATCNHIQALLKKELEVHLQELDEKILRLDLEKIFIENEIYLLIKKASSQEEANTIITKAIEPHIAGLRREPTTEEISSLTEIRIRRIAAFDRTTHEKTIAATLEEEAQTMRKLSRITKTTIAHFEGLLKKYGNLFPRRSRLHKEGFKRIDLAEVDAQNLPTFWNPTQGFIGTSLKKDEPLPFQTNPMTDVAAINKNGILKINRIGEKTFFAENLLDARLVLKNGSAPTYHMAYTDQSSGKTFVKSFQITGGFIREKAYNLAGGRAANTVQFLKISLPGENPPKIKVRLDPKSKAKIKEIEFDFASIQAKNREALGNTLTKYPVKSIQTL